MYSYEIADIKMDVSSDVDFVYERFKKFLTNNKSTSELTVNIAGSSFIEKPQGQFMAWNYHKIVYNSLTSLLSIYNQDDSGEIMARLDIDANWEKARITYNTNYKYGYYGIIEQLFEILFRNKIIFLQGLSVHAAALDWRGKGVLLSAPSGTGKTTQAGLWKAHKNAVVLNGDHPVFRIINDRPIVFGTPWSGSSLDFKNSSVPITSIIILQQAQENTIRRLNSGELTNMLLPRCFLPFFDENMMNLAADTFSKLTEKITAFLLCCRPEKQAVELVCQAMVQAIDA